MILAMEVFEGVSAMDGTELNSICFTKRK